MKVYIAARNSPSVFYALTGLHIYEFDYLNKTFCHFLPVNPSTGRPHTLAESAHKLFFILFYYRHYPIQQLAAIIMQVNQSQISRWIKFLSMPFQKATGKFIHKAHKKIHSLDEFKKVCPELTVVIDASERPIKTPKYNQQSVYSGKKHRHTVKNCIAINPHNKNILITSKTVVGKMHDFELLKRSKFSLPSFIKILVDLGFIGANKLFPSNHIFTPNKASKYFKLTDAARSQNKLLSSLRARIEHVFALMKHNRILADEFRGSGSLADSAFQAIAGLHNFKMQCRHS